MRIAKCLLLLCCGFGGGADAQHLLVVNQADSSLGIIDPLSGKQVATLAEGIPGMHAHEVASSPDGRTAYLPIYGNVGVGKPGRDGREMLVVDLPSGRITGRVDFGHGVRPHLPVPGPRNSMLYVTTELDKTVTEIDPKTLKIVGTIPTGQEQSHMLVLSHDGRRGYTANVGPGTVSVLDMVHRKTLAIIPVSGNVQRIAISNDNRLVFTSDQTKPQLAVIDAATNKVKAWIPMPGTGYGAAATADGRWLLVALRTVHAVAVIDLHTLRVAKTIEVGADPEEMLIPKGKDTAYVSCSGSDEVDAIDLKTWTLAQRITAGKFPDGMAWAQ